jgi:CheY-like chemotaxis protein
MTNSNRPSRILVVNRSLDILNHFHDILNEQGYEVELSNYTFESLNSIEKLRPDLIILDFAREGSEEEWQLLKILKISSSVSNIPILLCVAPLFFMHDQEDRLRHIDIRLLFTPFDKDNLLTAVQQILSLPSK